MKERSAGLADGSAYKNQIRMEDMQQRKDPMAQSPSAFCKQLRGKGITFLGGLNNSLVGNGRNIV